MAFDGNGIFTPVYNWQTDKANGIKIRADRMDGQDIDIASGLTTCVTRDGQSPATANLPMATFKHTNVALGVAATDYARASQLQSKNLEYFTTGGTIDAYTLTPSPAVTALTPGLTFFIRIHATSITSTPTLVVSGLAGATIKNGDLTALGTAALVDGGVYQVTYQGTSGYLLPNRFDVPAVSSPVLGVTNGGNKSSAFTALVDTRYNCLFSSSGTITGPSSAEESSVLILALADDTIDYLWKPVLNSNGSSTPYRLPSNNTWIMTYSGTVQGWI